MNELTIFDMLYPKKKITKPIRLIECFAGYGSQALALKYLGVKFEHWKICEWAIKSIQAYKDIHFINESAILVGLNKEQEIERLYKQGISSNYNEPMTKEQINRLSLEQIYRITENNLLTHNLVNIQQVKGKDLEIVDTDKYEYIMTYSFPCQDLSLAGKGKGMSDTTTRSGLLWEVERILSECENKPQILLMENVPQVHNEDNLEDFNKWKLRLEEMGYKNYFQDLIATDFGIPQTRNRCFMISLLGDYSYTFPKPIPLKLKLKDMLEDNVDEKYYLSDKQINDIQNWNAYEKPLENMKNTQKSQVSPTLTTRSGAYAAGMVLIDEKYYLSKKMIDYITSKDDKYQVNENNLIINRDIACSKTTREGNTRADTSDYICKELPNNINIVKIKNTTLKLDTSEKDTKLYERTPLKFMNRNQKNIKGDYAFCVDTCNTGGIKEIDKDNVRIRKLTPRECFRLMGVKDEDFDKVKKNQSDSSLYHLAGDSIVVNVLMAIFKELL